MKKKWNQSYSDCMSLGKVSQHINGQYHGHIIVASDIVLVVDVQELSNMDTDSTISVVLARDERLSFERNSYDGIGPISLQNELWTYDDSNPPFHIWTSGEVLDQLSTM